MSEIRKPSAPKFMAYVATEGFEFFDDYESAKAFLGECMMQDNVYSQESPEHEMGIYCLDTGIQIEVVANKKDYSDEDWEEEWGEHVEDVEEVWKHEFIKIGNNE